MLEILPRRSDLLAGLAGTFPLKSDLLGGRPEDILPLKSDLEGGLPEETLPLKSLLEGGRPTTLKSLRDAGRAILDAILALELGRLISPGPNESLLMPDVLSLEAWLLPAPLTEERKVGVMSSPATLLFVDPTVRFRLRTVTDAGIPCGEMRGGVYVGAGSLERADCTLASRRCICAVRVRMCVRELEAGSLWAARRVVVRAGVLPSGIPPEGRDPGMRGGLGRGLGVMSIDGNRDFRARAGVLCNAAPPVREASDMGGDGGSCSSESVSTSDSDLVSGGVVINGLEAVECGELGFLSKVGDEIMEKSVDSADKCLASCFFILSCRSSASIFKSAYSSRTR